MTRLIVIALTLFLPRLFLPRLRARSLIAPPAKGYAEEGREGA